MAKTTDILRIANWKLGALAFFLFFFAYIGLYAFPVADDYTYGMMLRDNGLGHTFTHMYMTWSGRFMSNLVLAVLGYYSNYTALYHLFPAFHIVCLFVAGYFIVAACHTGSKRSSVFITLIFTATYLTGFVSMRQGFYWMAGSFTYQFAVNGLLGCIAVLARTAVLRRTPGWFEHILLVACALVGLGSSELTAVTCFWVFACFAFIALLNRHPNRMWFSAVTMLVFPFFAASMLAPGNGVRGELSDFAKLPTTERALFSLYRALGGGFEGFKWLARSAFLPGVLVLVPVLRLNWNGYPITRWRGRGNALFFFLFALSILFCDYFIAYWVSGKPPYARMNNSIYADAILIGFMGCIIFQRPILRFLERKVYTLPFASRNTCFALFLGVLLVLPNTSLTMANLATGKLQTYKRELELRHEIVANNKGNVVLPVLTYKPLPVFFRDIDDQRRKWVSRAFQKYWKVESITLALPQTKGQP